MEFNYKDVIDRGFKREECHDQQFINQNGYDWFVVTKQLTKSIYLDWDSYTHEIELIRCKEDTHITGRIKIVSEEMLDEFINFFKK